MPSWVNDPSKLVPVIIAVGAVVLAAMGRINTQEFLMILGLNQAGHGLISAIGGK